MQFLNTRAQGIGRVWTVEQFCEFLQITRSQFDELLEQGLPHLEFSDDGTVRILEEQTDPFSSRLLPMEVLTRSRSPTHPKSLSQRRR